MQRAHSSQVLECLWQEATLRARDEDFHAEATSSLEGLHLCALQQTSFFLCRLWSQHLYSLTITIFNVQSSALHCKRELAHLDIFSVFPISSSNPLEITFGINYFGRLCFHWHQPSSVCLALFVFYRHGLGSGGGTNFFVFPKAMWKKRFTCLHNMTVWASWPMKESKLAELD